MKYKFIKLLLVICLFQYGIVECVAQNESQWVPVTKKKAVSLSVAGTTPFIGVTYESLISDKFNFEAGLGVFSAGLALKYFPFPIYNNKMVFHLNLGTNIFATPFDTFGSEDYSSTTYLTFGLSYFGREGFNFGLGIGPSVNYDFTFNETSQSFYGNLKLGYRF